MEEKLVLSDDRLNELGFDFLFEDPSGKVSLRHNKTLITVFKNREGAIYKYEMVCGNYKYIPFKSEQELLEYCKVEEKKEPELRLSLSHAELLALGFEMSACLINGLNEYSKSGIKIYRDSVTGNVSCYNGQDYTPFKTMKDFNKHLGIFDERACEKAIDENLVKLKGFNPFQELQDAFNKKMQEEKKDNGFNPCPKIQEDLNEIMQDSKFSQPTINTKELKTKLEFDITELLNNFEKKTGFSISDLNLVKTSKCNGTGTWIDFIQITATQAIII